MTHQEVNLSDYKNSTSLPNGAALAALLAGGVGAFAMGLVIILNEAGVLTVPSLYEPAGGVTGRTTLAVVVWLITWSVLHNRWKNRRVDPRRVFRLTMLLVAAGLVLSFPPVWGIL
jgi:hypothetical protein